MRIFLILFAAVLAAAETPGAVVFDNVTVIDATGTAPKVGMRVVITNGRIQSISRAASNAALPGAARIIDAHGKFLIPGLWDMHVHIGPSAAGTLPNRSDLSLYIANGVTGVRVMAGEFSRVSGLQDFPRWRQEVADGELLGPRMILASLILDGPKGRPKLGKSSGLVRDADEGRARVREAIKDGADFIKVYSSLPREGYFAIADEAKKQHIPFAGHMPVFVSAAEVSNAGQASIEHLSLLPLACSSREQDIRAAWVKRYENATTYLETAPPTSEIELMLESYSDAKASALFETFARNHTWLCPTLITMRNYALPFDASLEQDARLKYMSRDATGAMANYRKFFSGLAKEDRAARAQLFQKQVEIIGALYRSGNSILAGTDGGQPYNLPGGFWLHDELRLLVNAGLKPMDALRSATSKAAEFADKADSFGTIEAGKVADLVLLDASPLEDIANTAKINAVMFGGKLFTRSDLDRLLNDAEKAAAGKH